MPQPGRKNWQQLIFCILNHIFIMASIKLYSIKIILDFNFLFFFPTKHIKHVSASISMWYHIIANFRNVNQLQKNFRNLDFCISKLRVRKIKKKNLQVVALFVSVDTKFFVILIDFYLNNDIWDLYQPFERYRNQTRWSNSLERRFRYNCNHTRKP